MTLKLKNLQKSIHNAAIICCIPCPLGVDKKTWDDAVTALYKANEQIDRIVKTETKK
jgi:hypothetical protein